MILEVEKTIIWIPTIPFDKVGIQRNNINSKIGASLEIGFDNIDI